MHAAVRIILRGKQSVFSFHCGFLGLNVCRLSGLHANHLRPLGHLVGCKHSKELLWLLKISQETMSWKTAKLPRWLCQGIFPSWVKIRYGYNKKFFCFFFNSASKKGQSRMCLAIWTQIFHLHCWGVLWRCVAIPVVPRCRRSLALCKPVLLQSVRRRWDCSLGHMPAVTSAHCHGSFSEKMWGYAQTVLKLILARAYPFSPNTLVSARAPS